MSLFSGLGRLFGIKDPPKPPDPAQLAAQQQQYNRDAASWNANQYMGTAGRSGPFGSVAFGPGGQSQAFSGQLGTASGNLQGNLAGISGALPEDLDFSSTEPEKIAARNYAAYQEMQAPSRAQQYGLTSTDLTNRGLPVGNEAWNNTTRNLFDGWNRADTDAAARAWNAVPGMQAQMTDTTIRQGMAPGGLAAQNLGLLGGLGSLLPGYNSAPQYGAGSPDYMGAANANYAQQLGNYRTQQEGLGNLFKAGASLLAAPMTGGTSLIGTGAGLLGGMFGAG